MSSTEVLDRLQSRSADRERERRADLRRVEVERIFAELQEAAETTAGAEDWIVAAARYYPPWREVRHDGSLTDPFGPESSGGYQAQWSQWRECREAGSLWDADTAQEHGRKLAAQTKRVRRAAADPVVEFLATDAAEVLTDQERVVATAVHVERRALDARELGVEPAEVAAALGSVRRRVRAWLRARRADEAKGTAKAKAAAGVPRAA